MPVIRNDIKKKELYNCLDPITFKNVWNYNNIPMCCRYTLFLDYLKELRHKNFTYNKDDIQEWFENGKISINNRYARNTYNWKSTDRESDSNSRGIKHYYF